MKTMVALLLLSLASTASLAADTGKETVQLEIVLMRHGVRSPTKPATTYAAYANAPWPAWPVAPGMLTPHGRDGMQGIGARLRQQFTADGLMSDACPDAASFVVIGDSTPRNRESTVALLQGLAPDCNTPYLAMDGTANNPLFHFRKDDDDDDTAASPGTPPPALAELQSVLLGCKPDQCADVAVRDGKQLILPTTDRLTEAMKLAGTLSENLMLAYVDGMPMQEVAFGRGDATVLGRLITLHNDQFAATKKALPAASRAGSNLVAHILATLDAARGAGPPVAPLTTAKHGIVILVGHDTNLANVAGILGLDWHNATRPDDYPPGGSLLISLVKTGHNETVRLRVLMPTMDQLRGNRFDAMVVEPVLIAGCPRLGECPAMLFGVLGNRAIDTSRLDAPLPPMVRQAPARQGPHR